MENISSETLVLTKRVKVKKVRKKKKKKKKKKLMKMKEEDIGDDQEEDHHKIRPWDLLLVIITINCKIPSTEWLKQLCQKIHAYT